VAQLRIELDPLPPAERRDLANALLRAAWSAALEDTRILLLDLLMRQVGHADSKMTMDVYAQLQQRAERQHGEGSTRSCDGRAHACTARRRAGNWTL